MHKRLKTLILTGILITNSISVFAKPIADKTEKTNKEVSNDIKSDNISTQKDKIETQAKDEKQGEIEGAKSQNTKLDVQNINELPAVEPPVTAPPVTARTQTSTQQSVNITDINLLKAINKSLGKGDNITTPVTQIEIDKLIVLRGEGYNISDLSGLENASNLQEVYLANNKITDISKIQNLSRINIIELQTNTIQDINALASLPNIGRLNLSNNKIVDASPINNLKNLSILNLSNNKITTNILKGLSALTNIDLNSNEITGELTIESGNNLFDVNLNHNKITAVNLNATSVKTLSLAYNNITDCANLKGNFAFLENLNINNNSLTNISSLDECVNLKHLNASTNNITDTSSIEKMVNLEDLVLYSNNIKNNINLLTLKNLYSINISYCHITDSVFDQICELNANYSKLKQVHAEYNDIYNISKIDLIHYQNGFANLNLDGNHISNINYNVFSAYRYYIDNISIKNQSITKDVVVEYNNSNINIKDVLNGSFSFSEQNISNNGTSNNGFIKWTGNEKTQSFNFNGEVRAWWTNGFFGDKYTGNVNLNLEYRASIKAPDITVEQNSQFDKLTGVNIEDDGAVDMNSLVITGTVDTTKLGINKLTYTYTDSDGNKTVKDRTVKVAEVGSMIVNIPDLNLKRELNKLLGYGDVTVDITNKELESLHGSLNLSNKGIENLKGIQALKNVESLNLSNNKFKDDSIQYLKDMDVKYLDINTNASITDITSISQMPNLKELYAKWCNISKIGEWDSKPLNILEIGSNKLSDIKGLKGADELRKISLDHNESLKDISVLGELKNLQEVYAYSNKITTVGNWDNSSVKIMDIYENPDLKDISGLSKNKNLKTLVAYNSGITTIGDWSESGVESINLIDNKNLTDISGFAKAKKLNALDVQRCNITNIGDWKESSVVNVAINENPNLLDISGFSKAKHLKSLDAHLCNISNLGEWEKSVVDNVNLDENKALTDITGFARAKQLRNFTAKKCSIDNLGDWSNSIVETLFLDSNKISDISTLSNMKKLKELNLESNNIVSISNGLDKLISLTKLNLNSNTGLNNIKEIGQKCSSLEELLMIDTAIDSFNHINKLSRLKLLYVGRSKITSLDTLDADKLINLQSLDIANLNISDIKPLEKLKKLQSLNISNNHIGDLTPINWFSGKLNAGGQEINSPMRVEQNTNGIYTNNIIGLRGTVKNISSISNLGTYDRGTNKVTWYTPAIGSTQQYNFSDGNFSGVVKVPIRLNIIPIITAFDKNYFLGDDINEGTLLKNVYGYDANDGILNDKVKILENNIPIDANGKANLVGKYKVKYLLTDSDGSSTEKEINVTVRTNESPKINGANDVVLNVGGSIDLKDGISIKDDHDTNEDLMKTLKIENNLDVSVSGVYSVKYIVTDSDNNTTELVRVINVIEDPTYILSIPSKIHLGSVDDELSTNYKSTIDRDSLDYDKKSSDTNSKMDGIVGAKKSISLISNDEIKGNIKIYTDSEFQMFNTNNVNDITKVNVYKTFTDKLTGDAASKSDELIELNNSKRKDVFRLKTPESEFKTKDSKYEGIMNFIIEFN